MKKSSLPRQIQKYAPIESLGIFGLNGISQTSLQSYFYKYLLPIVLGCSLYIPTDIFKNHIDKTPLYVCYLIVVSFCVSLGGFTAGALVTVIILIETLLLLQPFSGQFILNSILFVLGSIVVTAIIDGSHKAKELQRLKEKEKKYAQNFIELHNGYIKSREEIRARDEFLSIVSHELKTPLTAMLLKLHYMLNSVRNTSLAKFSVHELMKVLSNAEEQVKQLSKMINDLVNVSLITTGRMSLNLETCDLNKVTKDVVQSFSELLKREKYKLNIENGSPVIGRWDKSRIEQVITNLVSNAIKYGQGKPINIKLINSGGVGKFIIEDRGVGIANQEQGSLFDRFKRLKSADEHREGLGVGLYVTAQIVKAHGGHVKVSSAPMKGSRFTIELPLKTSKKNLD